MTSQRSISSLRMHGATQRLLGIALGLGATFPALAGITIPDVPLQSGAAVPPNIVYLLDNSGSMGGTRFDDVNLTIEGSVESGSTDTTDINASTYTANTLYYNPAIEYRPWRNADGTYPPDKAFTSAFDDTYVASGSTNLRTSERTFHVPISNAALTNVDDYYRYRFRRNSDNLERCKRTYTTSWGWRECVNVAGTSWTAADATVVTRTLDQERTNFANWYSYHRTRALAAKAGSGQAFAALGSDVRVGYGTIHNLSNTAIPVATDNGLFRGANRTAFFDALYGETRVSGTPLRSALQNAGEYYSRTAANGPWGPESGTDQLSCRQNFTILTTDGYWNNGGTTYDNAAGNADGGAGTAITGPNGLSYTYAAVAPFSDTYSNTLADVAMQYWKTDLRPFMTNNVPTTPGNPAFWQHMVTFGISIGLRGSLDPATDLPALTAGTKSWPNPTSEDLTRIDDLWHATVNGRGTFVAATEPDAFTTGLRDALAAIVSRTSSNSNVAANSTSIGSDTRIFQASFISGQWTGELKAFPITAAGVGATPSWSASSLIPTTRSIFTWNGSGATFPTTAQTTALTAPVAAYIRGVRSNEVQNGGSYRDRLHLLGDIVNSSPAFVKDTGTIYVGANDGMLHAFNGATGVEQFAYVPAGIDLDDLGSLSSTTYAHRFFVDGPIIASTRAQTPNQNIVVGALGRGGKGLFALDATNPATFASGNVLWDKTGSGAPAGMGKVLGRPVIGRMNNGDTAVIVANGPNSTNHTAVLFVYNLATGALISTIDTGVGSAASPNGLSAPRGWDSDGDGTIDYVYAGDLLGNLWRFNLSSNSAATWNGPTNRVIMYAAGAGKPITGAPSVALDPIRFDTWVFFGTGRYLTNGDPADTSVQSLFGIIDSTTTVPLTDLQQRSIINAGAVAGRPVRGFEPASAMTAGKTGWQIDLVTPPSTAGGERMVSDMAVVGRLLISATIIPSSDPCAQGGRGYINALDAFTGASGSTSFFDVGGDGQFADDVFGTPETPVGSVDLGVAMPTAPGIIESLLIAGGSDGSTGTVKIDMSSVNGRISWRETVRD